MLEQDSIQVIPLILSLLFSLVGILLGGYAAVYLMIRFPIKVQFVLILFFSIIFSYLSKIMYLQILGLGIVASGIVVIIIRSLFILLRFGK